MKKGSRLISMVNTFAHYAEEDETFMALSKTAREFGCRSVEVAEAVFPYLSDKERTRLFNLRRILPGAKFIYRCRVTRGIPVSRMSRYYRHVA